MRDSRTIGIGREALLSLVSKFSMGVLGFVGTVVFARELGASGLGVYQTAMAAAMVASRLSGGVGTAVRKRVSEVDADVARYLGLGLIVHLGLSAAVLAAVLLFFEPAVAYFGSPEVTFGVVALVVAFGLFEVVNRTYAGAGYPARSSWLDALRSLLTLGAQLTLLWIGLREFGLIVGLAVGTVLSAGVSGLAAGVTPRLPTLDVVRRLYDHARWSAPNELLKNVYSSSDIIILTAVVGSTSAGLYAAASQLVVPAAFLAASIVGALAVKTSGRHSAGEDVVGDLTNSVAYSGLFAIPMLFGALAMPRALLRTVFTGEFAAAGGALIGMGLFQVWNVYAKPFESVFTSVDRPDLVFRVNVLVTGLHLPVAVAAGLAVGLLGVVAATVVAEFLRLCVYLGLTYRRYGTVAVPRQPLEQVGSAVAMFVALEAVLRVVTVRGWAVLVALVGGGAAVYAAVLFAISPHFRLTLRNTVPFGY
jgi:O-antigen/teichoic acid export membrane protein